MFGVHILEKYFENIIINLLFSATFMFLFYLKLRIIPSELFSCKAGAVLFLCELFAVLLCAVYICCISHTFPPRGFKLGGSILIWCIVFFTESLLIRKLCLTYELSKGILFSLCSAVYALLFAVMVLSLCNCIHNYKKNVTLLTVKSIRLFIKLYIFSIGAIVAICIAAFVPVNTRGSNRNLIIVPDEVTAAWEGKIFTAILFLFIPLYALTFIQLFEEMTDSKKIN